MGHLLSLLIWLPIIGGLFVLLTGDDAHPNASKQVTLFVILLSLIVCGYMLNQFDLSVPGMQFVENLPWMPSLGIHYHLGVDGLSLLLVVLSVFTTLVAVLATWNSIKKRVAQYLAAFLIMQGLLVGVFAAMDSILFYLFWETTLVPMYLIIGIWGSDNRVYAAVKFFLFTFLGSVLMLAAFLYLNAVTGSFDIETLYAARLTLLEQTFLFIAFFLGFAIKIPMFIPGCPTPTPKHLREVRFFWLRCS